MDLPSFSDDPCFVFTLLFCLQLAIWSSLGCYSFFRLFFFTHLFFFTQPFCYQSAVLASLSFFVFTQCSFSFYFLYQLFCLPSFPFYLLMFLSSLHCFVLAQLNVFTKVDCLQSFVMSVKTYPLNPNFLDPQVTRRWAILLENWCLVFKRRSLSSCYVYWIPNKIW